MDHTLNRGETDENRQTEDMNHTFSGETDENMKT